MCAASLTLALVPWPSDRYREEFPIFERAIYLNSCSLGALSRRSRQMVNEYLDEWEQRGAAAWYDVWWDALDELRASYARLLDARRGTVALHPSISSALTAVAESIDYSQRPKVIVTSLDFPTLAYQWLSRVPSGVEVQVLQSPDGIRVPLELWERAIDERTALVATSHVFFTSGAIQDVEAIGRMARQQGALTLIDGYQAVGQVPVSLHSAGIDFYAGGGLKWLLGGSGIAFLYASEELHPTLHPRAAGWFGQRDQFSFDPAALDLHDDARRLETGTPSMMAVYAQLGGLAILSEIGLGLVEEATAALATDLVERARERGLKPRVPHRKAERSAIVTFPHADPVGTVARLANKGIIVDARPGHVRVSPYFYNTYDDITALLEHLG